MSSTRVVVRGVDGAGTRCAESVLGHGADPRVVLAEAGWTARELVACDWVDGRVVLTFRVRRARPIAVAPPVPEAEVAAEEAAGAVRLQRVAAYAVVGSRRGVLLSEFSDKTSRPGTWGLPGGGLESDEAPDSAVHREIWEESGQSVMLDGPIDAVTHHWVGAAPSGRIEDFHAVRLIYRAHCENPTDPVVHEVGGTTRSAAWWARSTLGRLDLTPWTRALLTESDG